jgi:hypothetical protein
VHEVDRPSLCAENDLNKSGERCFNGTIETKRGRAPEATEEARSRLILDETEVVSETFGREAWEIKREPDETKKREKDDVSLRMSPLELFGESPEKHDGNTESFRLIVCAREVVVPGEAVPRWNNAPPHGVFGSCHTHSRQSQY